MSKRLEKAMDLLGTDKIQEMESMPKESLKQLIVQANDSMKQAQEEMENNPKYVEAKERLSDLSAGKKEVDKRQKAIILVALTLLNQA